MNGFKTFKVVPDVPEKLKGLFDIAYNVWLTWYPDAIRLFWRLDADLWNKSQHNPVKVLGEVSQARLEELANDEGYVVQCLLQVQDFLDIVGITFVERDVTLQQVDVQDVLFEADWPEPVARTTFIAQYNCSGIRG